MSGSNIALVTQDTRSLLLTLKPRVKTRVSFCVAVLSAFFVGAGVGAVVITQWSSPAHSGAAEATKSGYRAAQAVAAQTPSTPASMSVSLSSINALPVIATPTPPRRELECLTDAVYYEARGESLEGQAAVAQVVLNRARAPRFPKSVCGVVFQGVGAGGCQFSFACNGAMAHTVEWAAWGRAQAVAARALNGYVMDAVGTAVQFHGTHSASGDLGQDGAVARIGRHLFLTQNQPATSLNASRTVVSEPRHGIRVFRGGASERVLVAMDRGAPSALPPQEMASQ